VSTDDIQGRRFPLVGQGDDILGGIIDMAFLGKIFQGTGDRRVLDP
jgi:hypothetical protein